ncbi:MAG: hypothetical protein KAX18_05205, partial [Candidatus Lokiarchaeota archaeon]|nr:hypothetical protein [Candidatus Lokiarchaeota archaeon]
FTKNIIIKCYIVMTIYKKDYKKDIAPIGFFFDIIPTELFKVPILPIPMRIDKVVKGEITYFIRFNTAKLFSLFKELNLFIDFKSFFIIGIRNLLDYAKKNSNEIARHSFRKDLVRKWLYNSISVEIDIPDLTEDLTYLLSEFLKTYSFINILDVNDERYIKELINYCDRIIAYFQERLESNSIKIKSNGDFKEEKIYFIKKAKYYPRIIEINIEKFRGGEKNIAKKMRFVPYLIYDDILETFFYNKKLLLSQKKTPYNFTFFHKKGIILKYTTITINDLNNSIKDISELDNNELEKLIDEI